MNAFRLAALRSLAVAATAGTLVLACAAGGAKPAPAAPASTANAAAAPGGAAGGVAPVHGTPPGPAAGIPAHPSKLVYPPLEFTLPPADPYRHVLPSGPVAYVAEDHTLPLVTVTVLVRAGSWLDPKDRPGVAELTGSMLRKGGTKSLSPEEFDQKADFLAAEIGAGIGSTSGSASVDCITRALPECLDLFFAMMREPAFDAKRFAVEKNNLVEAMKQRNDDPDAIAGRELDWLLHGREHFASRVETKADLDRIRREDLVAFHQKWWTPANLIFSVSGDVATADVLAQLDRRLAGWKAGEKAPWPPPAPEFTPTPGVYAVEKDIPQGNVSIAELAKQRQGWDDPEVFPLLVMNEILGGSGFTSRITKRVRSDEGLAYSAGSSLAIGDFWPGTFAVYYQSKSPTVPLAAKISLEEVARIRTEPVSADELAVAKNSLVESFPRSFQKPDQIVATYARDEYMGRPHDYWQKYRDRVRAVTAEDVERVAAKYLDPGKMVFLVVGKWDDIVGGDPEGRAKMEEFFGGKVTHLPLRDPLTLEPMR